MSKNEIVRLKLIQEKIYNIRNKQVILDRDLAALYGVETKVLNQAVKRNIERFPSDFMFRLNKEEFENLRSQIVTLKTGRGRHGKYLPYAFTEQGVAMLSSVLNSKRAIQVNIHIMRVFAGVKKMLETHADLRKKIEDMERKYDKNFRIIFEAIKRLLEPPAQKKRVIEGFKNKD